MAKTKTKVKPDIDLEDCIDQDVADLLVQSKQTGIEFKERTAALGLAIKWYAIKKKLHDDGFGTGFLGADPTGDADG